MARETTRDTRTNDGSIPETGAGGPVTEQEVSEQQAMSSRAGEALAAERAAERDTFAETSARRADVSGLVTDPALEDPAVIDPVVTDPVATRPTVTEKDDLDRQQPRPAVPVFPRALFWISVMLAVLLLIYLVMLIL